jgi:hypothetical protein
MSPTACGVSVSARATECRAASSRPAAGNAPLQGRVHRDDQSHFLFDLYLSWLRCGVNMPPKSAPTAALIEPRRPPRAAPFPETGYHIAVQDRSFGWNFGHFILATAILILLMYCLQYSAAKHVVSLPPLLPQAMTYDEKMQMDFHKAIDALANSVEAGAEQDFDFGGVHYRATYIPDRRFRCFYDIKPASDQPLDPRSALLFTAPKTDCADGPPYNEMDAQRVYNQRQVVASVNPYLVCPLPGLGAPQQMPNHRAAGVAKPQNEPLSS